MFKLSFVQKAIFNFILSSPAPLRSVHTRQHIAATMCVLENFCENLCLRNRILLLQHVAKNQIRHNVYHLLWRQNSVAETKIYTRILQYT